MLRDVFVYHSSQVCNENMVLLFLLKGFVWILQAGFSILRLFVGRQWHFLLIDHRVPVFVESGTRVFASCCDPNEIWAPLVEKVFFYVTLLFPLVTISDHTLGFRQTTRLLW
jgi:hypothetical protein